MERLASGPMRQAFLRKDWLRNPKNVKNPKNQFSQFFNWKMLSPSLFRTKSRIGVFGFPEKFPGYMGGYRKKFCMLNAKSIIRKRLRNSLVAKMAGLPGDGSAACGWSHPANDMPKHLTMNDLQYNRHLGGAKPVKVCQSDRVGFPSARDRRPEGPLRCAAKTEIGANKRDIQLNSALFSIVPVRRGKWVGGLAPSQVPGFRDQVSTGNIGNTVTVLAGKRRQTGNRKHFTLATSCSSTV